jgi:hypothetical protein
MSKPRDPAPVQDRLARLLDTPQLARAVPLLGPDLLHQLIEYRGLHACGDLLSLATREQLSTVLDLDLWRPARAAGDDQFDPDRFGEWVETLIEVDESVAARIVAGLDQRLVVAGLSRFVRVADPATSTRPWSVAAAADGAEERFSGSTTEVGGYVLRARRSDTWDAIVTLLVALEAGHRDCFHAVMRGCRRLSNSLPERDGLDGLLPESAQLLHDVALQRDERRSEQGYLTPADARAFLQMAREAGLGPPSAANPIAAAYLSAAEAKADPADAETPGAGAVEPPDCPPASEAVSALAELLAEAGVVPGRPSSLLLEAPAGESPRPARLRALMEHVSVADERACQARSRELAFLANCLMAGCSIQARSFTAGEASDAVVATCELGFEHWPARWPDSEDRNAALTAGRDTPFPDGFLLDHDLVTAFQVGWAVLHEMSLSVAERLVSLLADLRFVEGETQEGLDFLRRELARQHRSGTPWRARDALDVIAILDMLAWTALLGVLDECPVLPAALRAVLEGRTGAVSATAFEFISTVDQMVSVRAFVERLPEVLVR